MRSGEFVGVVTKVNSTEGIGYVWTVKTVLEKCFRIEKKLIGSIKVGTWISFEVNNGILENVEVISQLLKTEVLQSDGNSTLKIYTQLVFPPSDWAVENGYQSLVYSIDFGKVGNFAAKELLKKNGKIVRCVGYRGFVCRIPERHEKLVDMYGTVWALPAQELHIENELDLKYCPWNEPKVSEFSNKQLLEELDAFKPVFQNIENTSIKNDITQKTEISDSDSNNTSISEAYEDSQSILDQQPKCLGVGGMTTKSEEAGVVVCCRPSFNLIWSKGFGCILASFGDREDSGVNLKLGQWVLFSSFPDPSIEIPGVKYTALSVKPICDLCHCLVEDERILCNTVICESQTVASPSYFRESYVAFESKYFGVIYVDGKLAKSLEKVDGCIECTLRLAEDPKTENPWELYKVKRGMNYIKVDILMDRCKEVEANSGTDQPSTSQCLPISRKASFTLEKVINELTEKSTCFPNSANCTDSNGKNGVKIRSFELKELKEEVNKKVHNLPKAIFLESGAKYGVIWSPHKGTVAVRHEHIGFSSLEPGVWVTADIVRSPDSEGLEYRYVTASPLRVIPTVLPIRVIDGVVHVQVLTETQGQRKLFGNPFVVIRRSEVGEVHIPLNKIDGSAYEKKLLVWVFMSNESKCWEASHTEESREVSGVQLQGTNAVEQAGRLEVKCLNSTSSVVSKDANRNTTRISANNNDEISFFAAIHNILLDIEVASVIRQRGMTRELNFLLEQIKLT